MKCEHCGEKDAVIHLTQIVNNAVTTMHLCESCAAEKGVETGAAVAKFPLGDFLATLGKETGAEAGPGASCPTCGATLQDFRQTGRLGCAACYVSFERPLRDLLRRLHGSTRHVGRAYLEPEVAAKEGRAKRPTIEVLRQELKRAVEAENFELAAELRDRIRVLE
jgi:protein arginine kinase activator